MGLPDDHGLAVHGLQPLLVMGHQIGSQERDALGIADQCLQGRPLGLEALLAGLLIALGDLIELGIQLGERGGVQGEFGACNWA